MSGYVVQARTVAGGVSAELKDYRWGEPCEYAVSSDRHFLSLLVGESDHGLKIRFADIDTEYTARAPIMFMPAGTTLAATCAGGVQDAVLASMSQDRFSRLAGRSYTWTEDDLARVLDLPEPIFRPHLLRIAAELGDPSFGTSAAIESLVTLVFVDLLRYLGNDRSTDPNRLQKGGLTPRQLRRVNDRIDDDEAPLPTVSELADTLGISSRHLLRGFRHATGLTLQQHIKAVAEKRALHLVKRTDLPLKVIARRLGFELPGSFSTAFREAYGVSPSELRRSLAG